MRKNSSSGTETKQNNRAAQVFVSSLSFQKGSVSYCAFVSVRESEIQNCNARENYNFKS